MKLSKPIQAHGAEVTEVVLRAPTGADIRLLKALPFWLTEDEVIDINTNVAAKYVAHLASIPPSSVDKLSGPDLNQLFWEVVNIFSPVDGLAEDVVLREPTGADIRAVRAMPYWVAEEGKFSVNTAAAMAYIERLGGLSSNEVDELPPAALGRLFWQVVGFFNRGESQNQASSST